MQVEAETRALRRVAIKTAARGAINVSESVFDRDDFRISSPLSPLVSLLQHLSSVHFIVPYRQNILVVNLFLYSQQLGTNQQWSY